MAVGPNGGLRITRDDLSAIWVERWRAHRDRMLGTLGPGECWPAYSANAKRAFADLDRYRGTRPSRGAKKTGYHRLVAAHELGGVPAGMVVMHRCDRPGCCNPAHLRIGTQKENQQDMAAKGRAGVICPDARARMGATSRARWGAMTLEERQVATPWLRRGVHPKSRAVIAPDGARWPSAAAAADDLGMTRQGIAVRCRTGWLGWCWAD